MIENITKIGIAAVILLAITMPFSVQSVSAVQVSEGVKFQTTGTNTIFIMGNNFTFDTIKVHSTYLMLNTTTISVQPSVGSINFTLFNFTVEYKKWNESCSNPGAITNHTMGGLKTKTTYLVKVNGAIWEHYMSNGSGYVFFTYSGGYSDIDTVFEMEEGICGDVTCDDVVDVSDVGRLLYYVGFPGQYTICSEWAADVTCDGAIDVSDVGRLLYHVGFPGDPNYPLNCC